MVYRPVYLMLELFLWEENNQKRQTVKSIAFQAGATSSNGNLHMYKCQRYMLNIGGSFSNSNGKCLERFFKTNIGIWIQVCMKESIAWRPTALDWKLCFLLVDGRWDHMTLFRWYHLLNLDISMHTTQWSSAIPVFETLHNTSMMIKTMLSFLIQICQIDHWVLKETWF